MALTKIGILRNFLSTGIDDNATSTALTIDANENATFANGVTASSFSGDGSALTGIVSLPDAIEVESGAAANSFIIHADGDVVLTSNLSAAYVSANLNATTVSVNDLTVSNTYTQGTGNYTQKRYVMYGTTSDDTETEIYTINNDGRIPVDANTTVFYEASFAARRTDTTGESGAWHLKGCVDNFSGVVADVGNVYEIAVAQDNINWQVDIRADNTNDTINVYVTGANNNTVAWTTVITTIEVSV